MGAGRSRHGGAGRLCAGRGELGLSPPPLFETPIFHGGRRKEMPVGPVLGDSEAISELIGYEQ